MDAVLIVPGLGVSDIAQISSGSESGVFLSECSRVSGVTAPFPCLPHVIAVSALTGCSASAHGLLHPFAATHGAPERLRRAYDGERCLHEPTVFSLLSKIGIPSAAFLCPSSAESRGAAICVPYLSAGGGASSYIRAGKKAYRYRRMITANSYAERDKEAFAAVLRLTATRKCPPVVFLTLWNLYYLRKKLGDSDERVHSALLKTFSYFAALKRIAGRLFVYGTGSLFSVVNAYPLPQLLRKTGLINSVYAQAADSGAYLFPYSGKERESERGFEMLERNPKLAGAGSVFRLCSRCAGMNERPTRVLRAGDGDMFIDKMGEAPMMASDLFAQSRGVFLFSGGGFVAGKKEISASSLDLLPTLLYTLGAEKGELSGKVLHGCF